MSSAPSSLSANSQCAANIDHSDSLKDHLLMQSNRDYKCICETCTCGRHRCPRPHVKGDFQTSYNNHYRQLHQKVKMEEPPSYRYKERHYPPEALMTRYKQTFVKQPQNTNEQLNKSRLENIGKSIVRPHVPFDTSTSYAEHYRPFELHHPINPQDAYLNTRDKIPDYNFKSLAKLQGRTAYKDHYPAPSPPKLEKSPYPVYRKPDVPFKGDSRYKEDYKQYQLLQPSYENYSQSLSQAPKVKFEGSTAYKDHYKNFEVKQQAGYSGKACVLEDLDLPQTNFLNSSAHVYYDQREGKFH